MQKFINIVIKYSKLTSLISVLILFASFIDDALSGKLPTIDSFYFINLGLGFIMITIALLPIVIFVDYLIIKSAKSLFNDFIDADNSGRIIIILVVFVLILRKIYLLSR